LVILSRSQRKCRKTASPRTTEVPTMKNNKRQETKRHLTQPQPLVSLQLCDTQKPRPILNTKERIQHHHRCLSQESQIRSD
jgi:hypothetical protein